MAPYNGVCDHYYVRPLVSSFNLTCHLLLLLTAAAKQTIHHRYQETRQIRKERQGGRGAVVDRISPRICPLPSRLSLFPFVVGYVSKGQDS